MPKTKNLLSSDESSGDEQPPNKSAKIVSSSSEIEDSSNDVNHGKSSDPQGDLQVGTDEVISDSSSAISVEEEGKFPDGYDADCLGGADDRARLDKMSEIDREAELYRRIEQRDELTKRKMYQKKLKKERKELRRKKREIQRRKKIQREKGGDSDDSDTEMPVKGRNKRAVARDSDDSDIGWRGSVMATRNGEAGRLLEVVIFCRLFSLIKQE